MKLKDYLGVRGRQAALASATGLAPAYIWQISNGLRPAPIEHCAAIERATDCAVSRRDLRPDDWMLIWPELANQEHSDSREAA
ncbi:transcriptional regulator [Ralstonia syzygii]|uniref:transcriptional regulator n=1 Tax=Ralstonia syzygii TaxID=28097 RepID=UPI0018D08533|nr:YdaS family helix-turn-helix protein [Ralstonia syzygii]